MYNERKDSFSIKNLLIQLLFIVLFVFILIWLFPSKKMVEDGFKDANTKFDVLTNRIYNDNLQTMKEAALYYYTTPRLPKNINDVESMTLREMIEKKLLIKFKDANNKTCDLDESYVEITKLEDEFVLKVNLKCTDNDAYILVYLGCYDYCSTAVCENKDAVPSVPIINPKPEPTPVCSYKYQKVVPNYIWSDWSGWSTDVVTQTDTREVETKVEETTGTREVTKYKDEEYLDKTKPIIENILVENEAGPVSKTYCSNYDTTLVQGDAFEWVPQGTSYYTNHPTSNAVERYDYVGVTTIDCDNCYNGVLYIYNKSVRQTTGDVVEKDVCTEWSTMSAPVYRIDPKVIGYETSTRQVPYTETEVYTISTNYYRFRTLSTTYTTLTEWSASQNDQNLLAQGYEYITSICK